MMDSPPIGSGSATAATKQPTVEDEPPPAATQESQTASDFINSQLQLEADAREALPYAFDSCTYALGPMRQNLFSCLTCNPPPTSASEPYTPAGICYSCSIACHGEHTLVELFNKRNFVCDCGTTRLPASSPCTLRANPETGKKGVHSDKPAIGNKYNQNFRNRFCGCGEVYDPHTEKGTMFQCLGLGTEEEGCCGEDWWHPECIAGFKRRWYELEKANTQIKESTKETPEDSTADREVADGEDADEPPVPPGFPDEDDFASFICYKCVGSNPWLKRYAGTNGFLPPFFKQEPSEIQSTLADKDDSKSAGAAEPHPPLSTVPSSSGGSKRKLEDNVGDDTEPSPSKRLKDATPEAPPQHLEYAPPPCKYESLPAAPVGTLSLFCKEDFRDHICHCPNHFPLVRPYPQLLEEEETYEPPLSESGNGDAGSGARSHGTGSLLDRGEAALNNVDRVRAIEGVMVYNHLRDKVKAFLQPFAESGQPVGAEDIKKYFEKLRGDEEGIRTAAADGNENGGEEDHRREQSGY